MAPKQDPKPKFQEGEAGAGVAHGEGGVVPAGAPSGRLRSGGGVARGGAPASGPVAGGGLQLRPGRRLMSERGGESWCPRAAPRPLAAEGLGGWGGGEEAPTPEALEPVE